MPLAEAFWTWAVLGGLAVNLSTSTLFLLLLLQDRTWAAFLAGYGLSVPYNILVTVAVWRSAARETERRGLAAVAPMATLIGMTILSLT